MEWKDKTFREAKYNKNDEFYTLLPDVENELKHYNLRDKIIYCPCDNYDSAFVKYFTNNFSKLGIKKLIATSWNGESKQESEVVDLFNLNPEEDENNYPGTYLEITDTNVVKGYLKGNGDFRSQECQDLMTCCDVVITNPPFSLFRELVIQIQKYKKDFILLGNNNALICKEIFPQIQQGKIVLGTKSNLILDFKLPDGTIGTVHGLSWFTTLIHSVPKPELKLTKSYSPIAYPTYVNYPAIEVNRLNDIPKDYYGEMGVPITYLGKHNPNQFEITGLGRGQSNPRVGALGKSFVDNYNSQDPKRCVSPDCTGNLGFWQDGKAVIPYMRILIKRKENIKNEVNN